MCVCVRARAGNKNEAIFPRDAVQRLAVTGTVVCVGAVQAWALNVSLFSPVRNERPYRAPVVNVHDHPL